MTKLLVDPSSFFRYSELHKYTGREKPYSAATLFRFRAVGVNGVRLKTWKMGGSRVTTLKAVREFIEGQTAGVDG